MVRFIKIYIPELLSQQLSDALAEGWRVIGCVYVGSRVDAPYILYTLCRD